MYPAKAGCGGLAFAAWCDRNDVCGREVEVEEGGWEMYVDKALIRPRRRVYRSSRSSLFVSTGISRKTQEEVYQLGILPSALPAARRSLKESMSLMVVVKRGMRAWMAWSGILGLSGGCGGGACDDCFAFWGRIVMLGLGLVVKGLLE